MWRSRWAAIGAAVTVALGGGGIFVAQAASGPASSVVTIDPVRILDTRDPLDIGLAGPFVSAVGLDLLVTGTIPTNAGAQLVVPDGATGVMLNVTVVGPTAAGFLSVRPATATGAPTSSSLNFKAGDVVPNAVTVQLPTAGTDKGKIEITYDAFGIAGPKTDVLVDVVGYLQAGGGTPGPKGDQGIQGPPGPAGSSIGGIEFFNYSPATLSNSFGTTDTLITLSALTVTAPAAGFVTYTASGNLFPNAATVVVCAVRLAGDPGPYLENIDTFGASETHSFSRTQTFAVPAGDSTISLYCRTTTSTAVLGNPAFSAVYSPTRV